MRLATTELRKAVNNPDQWHVGYKITWRSDASPPQSNIPVVVLMSGEVLPTAEVIRAP